MQLKTSDFYYDLPKELIAQTPIDKRDDSRLLILNKSNGSITHSVFKDIINRLNEGDCLILNDSKVLPARIYGIKKDTGARVEFLLLKCLSNGTWECLAGPGKRAKKGNCFTFSDDKEELIRGTITDTLENGNRIINFDYEGNFFEILDRIGEMPLPPYINEKLKDQDRYQTVYANELGSAAAPTAGLHFTKELLRDIKSKGINIGFVTLHVGLGTFRPVKEELIENHKMHEEYYEIPKETADIINETKKNNKRVISVGTTSCRTLESAFKEHGKVIAGHGTTDIFIYPGYKFNVIDALITNFHLPESTLIMLVSAFAGYDNIMNAYKAAVNEKYRFFSFGDAMFIE